MSRDSLVVVSTFIKSYASLLGSCRREQLLHVLPEDIRVEARRVAHATKLVHPKVQKRPSRRDEARFVCRLRPDLGDLNPPYVGSNPAAPAKSSP
jgi:hypothetical protein